MAMKASSMFGSRPSSFALRPVSQLSRRALCQDAPLVEDRDAVAIFSFLHEMRGDDDGDFLLAKGGDAAPELAPRQWIGAPALIHISFPGNIWGDGVKSSPKRVRCPLGPCESETRQRERATESVPPTALAPPRVPVSQAKHRQR
jgi:hypothetical protein